MRRNNTSQHLPQRGAGTSGYKGKKGSEEGLEEENPCVQRPISLSQPQHNDGWQVVGRKKQLSDNNERGRGSLSQVGVNSNGQMEVEEEDEQTEDNAQFDDDDE